MFDQPVDNVLPMLVSFIATQKTKATRRTIRVYSTKPCPSSSTINLLKSSISVHPLSLREATKFVPFFRRQPLKTFPGVYRFSSAARSMPWLYFHVCQWLRGPAFDSKIIAFDKIDNGIAQLVKNLSHGCSVNGVGILFVQLRNRFRERPSLK